MNGNLLVVHGGAPTAVLNASLYGVIHSAQESGEVERILGARGGTEAMLKGDFIDLGTLDERTLALLPSTPGSYIGTSRYPLEENDYERILEVLNDHCVNYVLFNGGNGTMDACGKLAQAAARTHRSQHIQVVGIPKTIDNDIAVTDHAPGFGSAARYLAASVAELALDVAALPIHVCIIESMGRNTGWLTAASALAHPFGPHLLYVPEIPFDEEQFLDEAKTLFERIGGVIVVASEGLKKKDGSLLVPPVFKTGRSVYYGDVSSYLSSLVIKKLGIKARSEKPGILGRCSLAHQSALDREEAILAGIEAVKAALSGGTAVMVGFKRLSTFPYQAETVLIPIEEIMLHERKLPIEYIDEKNGIRDSYLEWCRPLIGGPLAPFARQIL
jgi:6-phosphofructokinase 1